MLSFRQRWRLACRLQDAWNRPGNSVTPATAEALFDEYRDEMRRVADLSSHVRSAGWMVAAAELDDRYSSHLSHLCERLHPIIDQLRQSGPILLSEADWFRELQQLDAEFDSVDVSWENHCLVVPTEPITFDDINLGPFAIEFHWERLRRGGGVGCFEIEALEPNPAAGNDVVTHPHVRDRSLCAGDAIAPIAHALAAGRLGDAFLLVRSVLRNYNEASPYVALDHWHGTPCADCGASCNADETYYCEGCDNDVCDECFLICASCERSRCGGCLDPCAICGQSHCSRCLDDVGESNRSCCPDCRGECSVCGKMVAADEITEDSSVCLDCDNPTESLDLAEDAPSDPLDNNSKENSHDMCESNVAPADADVRAASVVETAVLLSPR